MAGKEKKTQATEGQATEGQAIYFIIIIGGDRGTDHLLNFTEGQATEGQTIY
jgi:hypothetical protein